MVAFHKKELDNGLPQFNNILYFIFDAHALRNRCGTCRHQLSVDPDSTDPASSFGFYTGKVAQGGNIDAVFLGSIDKVLTPGGHALGSVNGKSDKLTHDAMVLKVRYPTGDFARFLDCCTKVKAAIEHLIFLDFLIIQVTEVFNAGKDGICSRLAKPTTAGFKDSAPLDHIFNILFHASGVQYFGKFILQKCRHNATGGAASAGFLNEKFREVQHQVREDIALLANDDE
jgi:hypothetical protein